MAYSVAGLVFVASEIFCLLYCKHERFMMKSSHATKFSIYLYVDIRNGPSRQRLAAIANKMS